MLGGLVVWLLAALAVGIVLGRGIRMADGRSPDTGVEPEPAPRRGTRAGASAARPVAGIRRRIPLPPIGLGLAASVVALETVGYVLRLTGATGSVSRVLSMDAPYSVPRMTVAAFFVVAALAALAGAARIPGRRGWWLSVAAVTAVIGAVKAGGTVHVEAMEALASASSPAVAVVLSVVVAGVVLAALAFVSRAERRDRRRVLTWLGAYAVASVGLSAVSTAASAWTGDAGRLAMAATFVEETGEGLAGVAVLLAVLIGVAPRLVLPASWALRRTADAHTVEVAEAPRRAASGRPSS